MYTVEAVKKSIEYGSTDGYNSTHHTRAMFKFFLESTVPGIFPEAELRSILRLYSNITLTSEREQIYLDELRKMYQQDDLEDIYSLMKMVIDSGYRPIGLMRKVLLIALGKEVEDTGSLYEEEPDPKPLQFIDR